MSKIDKLSKPEKSLDEIIQKVMYENSDLDFHKISKKVKDVLIENYGFLPYNISFILKRIKKFIKDRYKLNAEKKKILNLSKEYYKALNYISAVIIRRHLTEYVDNCKNDDRLFELIKLYFWGSYNQKPTKEELIYCKDKSDEIFCEVLDVLQKYNYTCKK